MSRCLDPQTPPDKAFRGLKHLLTRYSEDFGRLGINQLSTDFLMTKKHMIISALSSPCCWTYWMIDNSSKNFKIFSVQRKDVSSRSTQENVLTLSECPFFSDLLEIVTINLRGLLSLLKLEQTCTCCLSSWYRYDEFRYNSSKFNSRTKYVYIIILYHVHLKNFEYKEFVYALLNIHHM